MHIMHKITFLESGVGRGIRRLFSYLGLSSVCSHEFLGYLAQVGCFVIHIACTASVPEIVWIGDLDELL